MIRFLLAAIVAASPAAALELSLPVDCDMDGDCYIQSYPDRDVSNGYKDYSCNGMSYDGHKGLDIRVPSLDRLNQGVDILAAAPGQVRAIRDGEPDTGIEDYAKGKDCGNAVVILHSDGWETQYCHMKRGSIAVTKGQIVDTGDVLGRMGLSGRTAFPHLHLSVRHRGRHIDPFNSVSLDTRCGVKRRGMWTAKAAEALQYRGGGIVDAGLASRPVELEEVREKGTALTTTGRDAMLLWARFYGLRKGDVMSLDLTGPSGFEAKNNVTFDRNRAEHMLYAGKKTRNGWATGTYTGIAKLIRDGQVHDQEIVTLTVE
ncbi:MAG: M23 family metallopeptidase [Pikeienuella sp.]